MFGIDDIIGSVGGAIIGSFMDNSGAEDRQSDAQTFSAQQYATRYQTQVKDLQAAGLNPMLAYGQSPGNAPTGVAAPYRSPVSAGVAAYQQSRMTSAQAANIEADTENKKAQADLIAAQAAHSWASAGQANAQTGQIEQYTKNLAEELKNIPLEGKRLEFLVHNLYADTSLKMQQQVSETQRGDLLRQQVGTEVLSQQQIRAVVSKLAAETGLLNLDLEAAQKLGNLGRESKQLQPIIDIIMSLIRSRGFR